VKIAAIVFVSVALGFGGGYIARDVIDNDPSATIVRQPDPLDSCPSQPGRQKPLDACPELHDAARYRHGYPQHRQERRKPRSDRGFRSTATGIRSTPAVALPSHISL
jgi:hypothetical protein